MSNLLKDASILLTPTGYDNGSMNAIKPENGDGDFTFVRGSAATRVNAQGLVENVQIISSELITNGNFSQIGSQKVTNGNFLQEGSELVINGDFSNGSTDWNIESAWTISDGVANGNGANGTSEELSQSNVVTIGKTYSISYEVKNYVSGIIRLRKPQTINRNANGTYTETVTATSDQFIFSPSNFNGSITNISVKEVGQDWILGAWTVANGKASLDGSATSFIQQDDILESGKTYKVQYTISDYVSGTIRFRANLVNGSNNSSNGLVTDYIAAAGTNFSLQGFNGFEGSVSNISVKEVGQGWTVINGNITDKYNALMTAYQSGIRVSPFNKTGKFKVLFDLVITSGNMKFDAGGVNNQTYTTSGTKEIIIINPTKFEFNAFNLGWVGTLDNVSVKEVTDDTNIPRINYEGFSYQDSLGSELVTNGTFDSDTAWSKGSGWSISDGKASKVSGDITYLLQNLVLETSKTYKITFTVTNYVSGDVKFGFTTPTGSPFGTSRTANGTYNELFTHDSNTIALRFRAGSTFDGSIDNISVKEYLGQEVVPDSGCGSWLLEPQSTNLVPYSEDFSQWVGVNSVIVALTTETSAPNGLLSSVYKITSGNVSSRIQVSSITSASNYTKSIFVKHSTNTTLRFDGSGSNNRVEFSITSSGVTLSSAASNVISTNIEDYGNGWFRISATLPAASDFFQINPDVSGNDNGSVYIWGAQLENQSFATSYIPTEGATNTRNQDIATNSGNATLINSTEGTLFAEMARDSNDGVSGGIRISDGTENNALRLFFNQTDTISVITAVGGSANVVKTAQAITSSTAMNKFALKWKLNDYKLYYNGVELWSDTSANVYPIGTLNVLDLSNEANRRRFNGKIIEVAVYKEALTDAELQCLTTI